MRQIRVAVVEDEDIFADKIFEYLNRYEQETGVRFQVSRFQDGIEILDNYKGDIDIIFFDIIMKHMDGMQAAERIRALDKEVILIFLTSMTDFAVKGYTVEALSYIVKPVEYFEFSQNLERAIGRIALKTKEYLTISAENGIRKIEVSDIFYLYREYWT